MKIAIGSDKSGFSAKEAIKAYLTEAGIFTPIIRLRARSLPWFRTAPMRRLS